MSDHILMDPELHWQYLLQHQCTAHTYTSQQPCDITVTAAAATTSLISQTDHHFQQQKIEKL